MNSIITKRSFSVLRSLRSIGRSLEAHPFERLPVTQKAAPAVWGSAFKRVGAQAALFVPAATLLLGWPLVARKVINGHV